MRWTTDKDLNRLLAGLVTDGWAIRRTGGQHIQAIDPTGQRRLSFSGTGSCRANLTAYRAAIAKARAGNAVNIGRF